MTKYILYIIFCCSLWLMGCEKEVNNIKLTKSDSKLSVACFISPQDTILRVSVTKSAPVVGSNQLSSENIQHANVTLSDGEKSILLTYDLKEQLYTATTQDFSVMAGKTYFLKVNTPDGLQAEASCKVPFTQNHTLVAEIDSSETGARGKEYYLYMKWQDTPVEMNYYRVFAEIETVYMYTNGTDTRYQDIILNGSQLFTDKLLDGARFTSPKGLILNLPYIRTYADIHSSTLYAYLLNTDENYYYYHQSVQNNNSDNPFSEPSLIYSNIEGGLGIFSAYNRTTVAISLK